MRSATTVLLLALLSPLAATATGPNEIHPAPRSKLATREAYTCDVPDEVPCADGNGCAPVGAVCCPGSVYFCAKDMMCLSGPDTTLVADRCCDPSVEGDCSRTGGPKGQLLSELDGDHEGLIDVDYISKKGRGGGGRGGGRSSGGGGGYYGSRRRYNSTSGGVSSIEFLNQGSAMTVFAAALAFLGLV